ncbi:MAG TPA: hypothetical protein VN256_15340 [Pyrinomonadaceae bacterium]|nr:hypothetical protein [Pyrinomonadaceae bacterium]
MAASTAKSPGGLDASTDCETSLTLGSLHVGARIVLRCRKDWRDATVAARSDVEVTLLVGSPSGHTYRLRRPADSPLSLDGSIPVLGEGSWRAGRVRYDLRW